MKSNQDNIVTTSFGEDRHLKDSSLNYNAKFVRYQHVEKYGNIEVEGIELGKIYVFDKIDGSNSSIWNANGTIKAGSRNRELTLDNDNQGFYEYVLSQDKIKAYLEAHPDHRLFGEWMVPHTLKTYRDDAWRKFYIFDVMINREYINYDIYKPWLEEFDIDYIPAICSITNASEDKLYYQLNNSVFLIEDGKGLGEGIVLKNYDFVNRYGRTTWAKIVRSEFKAKASRTMVHPEMKEAEVVELKIVEKYVTQILVDKVYAKIINDENGWSSKFIPRLLQTVYYDLIREEMWEILKKFKNPQINFKALRNLVVNQIKTLKPDLFS